MTGNRSRVCILCLRRFSEEEQEGRLTDLYSKFLVFTGRFLKVSLSEIFLERKKASNGQDNIDAFCKSCEALASHACDLYAELEATKLYLLKEVDELEKVTRLSTRTSVSSKLTRGLIKSAAGQLHIKPTQLNLYRKSLILSCKRKINGGSPKILVPRGLFPEYVKFTNSATVNVLMRLIIVFAFASCQPFTPYIKEPEGVLTSHKLPPQHKRRPRTKRKIADADEIKRKRQVIVKCNNEDVAVAVKYELARDDKWDNYLNDDTSVHDQEEAWSGPVSPTGSSDVDVDQDNVELDPPVHNNDVKFNAESSGKRPRRAILKKEPSPDSNLKKETTIFPCILCKKKFVNRRGLSLHSIRAHNTRSDYACNECGWKCKSSLEFLRHKRIAHPKGTFKNQRRVGCVPCSKCDRKFANNQGLGMHMHAVHTIREDLPCEICGDKFQTVQLRSQHIRSTHTLKLPCQICSKVITGELDFRRHVEQHERKDKIHRVFHCEFCPKTFVSEDPYSRHVKLAHGQEFTCSVCETQIQTSLGLRLHLLNRHETKQKNFWCHFCFRGFTNQQLWQLHRKLTHVGLNKLVCDEERCVEEFDSVEHLNEHLKIHIEEMRSTNISAAASEKESMVAHDNDDKSNLLGSMELDPPDISVFTCKTCGWAFLNRYNLTLHELTHTQTNHNKRYCCPEPNCDKMLDQTSFLVSHYNLQHGPKTRPYQCDECKTKFAHLLKFKIHLRCHLERKSGKKLVCDVCNEECLDTLSFNWHRRSHQDTTAEEDVMINEAGVKPEIKTKWKKKRKKRRRPAVDRLTQEDEEKGERREVNCDLCQETCESSYYLWKHFEKEHEEKSTPEQEKSFQCNFCSFKFAYQQTLQFHTKHLHPQNQNNFICDAERCVEVFQSHLELNEHLKTVHLRWDENAAEEATSDEEKFTINPSAGPSALPTQKILLKVTSISYCKICDWGFVNPDFLQLHELCHIPISDGLYHCPRCQKEFPTNVDRTRHFNLEHGKKIKTFKCLECPSKFFFTAQHLRSHRENHRYKQKHSKNTFGCEHCGKIFSDPSRYSWHKQRHDPANHRTCSEDGCDQKFESEKQLQRHLRMKHGHGERYPCAICGLTFVYESLVKKHTNEVHGARKFKCEICHKTFKRIQHLEEHLERHDATPSFVCTECGKAYKNKGGLDKHIMSIHTPDHLKRFGCPHCTYRTYTKFLLKGHFKTCSKNKGLPYDENYVDNIPTKFTGRRLKTSF